MTNTRASEQGFPIPKTSHHPKTYYYQIFKQILTNRKTDGESIIKLGLKHQLFADLVNGSVSV